MADETSSNAVYGGLYHLGMNFESEDSDKNISISVRTDDGVVVSMMETEEDEDGEVVDEEGVEIEVPSSERVRFVKFLRQMADLIESKSQGGTKFGSAQNRQQQSNSKFNSRYSDLC